IVHGAGSFGHPIVSRTEIHRGISRPGQLLAFAETQRWQNHWNVLITTALQREGLAAIPCQASSHAVMEAGRLVWMPLDAIRGLLGIGLVPVMYGVPAYDRVQKCSILSGDQIVPYLARELGAERIIHGTDVDGVFTEDPAVNPEAKLIREVTSSNIGEVEKCLRESSQVDVTGGMLRKVMELMDLARLGIESEILNANRVGVVGRALSGERGLGTIIRL
ncbi:MAG: isopentenyl phosphate kinase, partial [Candidatus Geothermarchaeales archaeon]